ncbi:hypothetical protein GCM10010170_019780 [Dactylosporangium salmoneum]|uniref:Uncharacterized protein n=1 Tax=Dactylosporangium salmoneum TaxID=53361 RepID=A0ABP5STS1_9ACTN
MWVYLDRTRGLGHAVRVTRTAAVALSLLLALNVAGCEQLREPPAPYPRSAAPTVAFDPPARFARPSVPLRFSLGRGDYEVTLDGHTVLIAPRSGDGPLQGAVFPSSVPAWQAAPVHPYAMPALAANTYPDAAHPRPVPATLGGRRLVLFGALVATDGGHRAVEVDAADPATGELAWHAELPVADGAGAGGWFAVNVFDAGPAGLLVGLAGEHAQSWLLDPATREVRWHDATVGVLAVEGYAVGTTGGPSQPHRVVALRLPDGTPAWSVDGAADRLWSAGPGLIAYRAAGGGLRLLDAATGAPVPGLVPDGGVGPCRYDGRGITVCGAFDGRPGPVFAVDPAARRLLWSRPDLAVSALFHGALYGLAVYDAATARVREGSPGLPAAPYAVNEYLAVAPADGAPFVGYFATG